MIAGESERRRFENDDSSDRFKVPPESLPMRVRHAAVEQARWFYFAAVMAVVAILLPVKSVSQAAHTTSQIKKPLIYQVDNVVHIHAEGPRPLLRALDALEDKYGWRVDYEDPQYPADLDLATNEASRPRRRHPKVDLKGSFSVEFNSGPAPDSPPDEKSVLKIVVDSYNQSDADRQFELREEPDGRLDVVGIGVRDQNGEVSSRQPILDLLITLTTKRRSANETIALICLKLAQQSKIPVTPSRIADDVSGDGTVAVGGTRVSARTLLSRTLATIAEHPSWRLLYAVDGKSYELSLEPPYKTAASALNQEQKKARPKPSWAIGAGRGHGCERTGCTRRSGKTMLADRPRHSRHCGLDGRLKWNFCFGLSDQRLDSIGPG
jgi:hypothetical protein